MNTEEINEVTTEKSKETLKKAGKIFLVILFNIIFPYIIYFLSNINNENFFVFREIRESAGFDLSFAFLYELVIVYGLYFFFKAIFKKSLRANIAIAILFNLISIISYYKVQVVEKPFLPEDILLIGSAFEIAGYGNLQIEPVLILQVFITTILLVIQGLITWYTKYEKYHKKLTRAIIGVVTAAILLLACLKNWSNMSLFTEDDYNYKLDHYHYGATVNFFKNMYKLIEKDELAIYSEEKLKQIKEEAQKLESNTTSKERPNIVVIMAESFTDITKVEGIEFNKDPLENYKNLIKEGTSGTATVSIYGGETSTSEFEYLTGSSAKFIPNVRYPYAQAMRGDTLSIVTTLKKEGYYTTSIHPNTGGFYNRENAYKHLGFDNSIFINDMQDIDNYYGENVSDMDTAEEIVKQYEKSPSDKKFIFTITMEAHMPFTSDKYPNNDIELVSNDYNLTQKDIEEIEIYTKSLSNFDKSLKYLTDYFKQKDEEVMLVVFGDHLPALNTLYEKAYGEGIEKYQPTYFVWTNYETELNIEKNISPAGLSMRILENANIDMPWYYKSISEFYKQYPVYEKRFVVDKDGNILDNDTQNEAIDNYHIIQFDILNEKNIE